MIGTENTTAFNGCFGYGCCNGNLLDGIRDPCDISVGSLSWFGSDWLIGGWFWVAALRLGTRCFRFRFGGRAAYGRFDG